MKQQLINNPLFTLGYAGLSRFMHTLFYFFTSCRGIILCRHGKQEGIFCITAIKTHISRQLSSFSKETINRKYLLQPRDIPIKCIWNIPFSMIGAFLPGIRPVNPHLLCKCHPVKGLTGSLAFLCLAGLEKQTATKYSAFWNLKTKTIVRNFCHF